MKRFFIWWIVGIILSQVVIAADVNKVRGNNAVHHQKNKETKT